MQIEKMVVSSYLNTYMIVDSWQFSKHVFSDNFHCRFTHSYTNCEVFMYYWLWWGFIKSFSNTIQYCKKHDDYKRAYFRIQTNKTPNSLPKRTRYWAFLSVVNCNIRRGCCIRLTPLTVDTSLGDLLGRGLCAEWHSECISNSLNFVLFYTSNTTRQLS